MKTVKLSDLKKVLKKDIKAQLRESRKAIRRTAKRAVKVVRNNAPEAFGELKGSVHAAKNATQVDAPHAEAVEVGSRPHYVPLEALVKWVKLRGMQGLTKTGRVSARVNGWRGSTSREHAMSVAGELRRMQRGGVLGIDAPEQIAKRIQKIIMERGTKPHFFVRKSLPEVMAILDEELRQAWQ